MNDITVLMTGAGAPGAPGIINCYKNNKERNIRIIGVDIRDRVATRHCLDGFERVLPATDEGFIRSVLGIARKHKVDVIQPLVTKELEVFARNHELFQDEGIAVCISPIEGLEVANNKGRLIDRISEMGLAAPETYKATNIAEFRRACTELGYPGRVICFKPSVANGSRGFRVVDSGVDMFDRLFNSKPDSTYISFDDVCDILASVREFPELLVMEFMPGDEYSVDMLVNRGKVLYCIPRLRLKMNGGISTNCKVVKNDEVIEYCTKIASELKLHGNIGIQVRYSDDNQVKILEINPRVQGSIVAVAAAGVNLPYYGLKMAMNECIPEVTCEWNLEMVRYWNEVYFDDKGHAFTF